MPLPRTLATASLVALFLAVLGTGVRAEDREVVEPRRFVLTLELEGRFEPRDAAEVAYESEVYGGPLEIVEASGLRRVAKGEVLVRFDETEGARDLANAERDLAAAELKLEKLTQDIRLDDDARERKLENLEENARRAEADLARWREVEKPLRIAQAELGLEGSENRLQDEIEELEQLEKMYKSDDLTEETEEIVIRRARRSLERTRKSVEFARQRHQIFMEVSLPRDEYGLVTNLADRKADLERYRLAVKAERALAQIEFQKAREAFDRQKERLADLRRDVDGLRLRAPMDGLAVPGAFAGGNWSDLDAAVRRLAPGETVKKDQTLYTILTPGNVKVAVTVPEKDLLKLEAGQTVRVRPSVFDDRVLEGVVAEVWPLPTKGRCPVEIALKETDAALMPGEAAKVEIAYRTIEDALTVPKSAIREVDGAPHVWVVAGDDTEARKVETGDEAEGRVHVRGGLEAGETILVEAPEAKK